MSQDLQASESLLDLAEQAIETQTDGTGASPSLFERLAQLVGGAPPGDRTPDRVVAGALFDAFATRRRPADRNRLTVAFTPVALPGAALETRIQTNDLLVRRATGERALGYIAVVVGPDIRPRDRALAGGWQLEGQRPGHYVQVVEVDPRPRPRADRFARRLLDSSLRLPLDTLVVRLQAPLGQPVEDEEEAPGQQTPPGPDSPAADRFVAAHGSRWCTPGNPNSATCRSIPDPRPIRRLIIHSLAVPSTRRRTGAQAIVLGWQREGRVASAHYIVDRDGTITQTVREAAVAFHAGRVNGDSIGIEHADVCNDPAPLTRELYERSAALVRDIARRHGFNLVVYGADTTDIPQATVSGHVHHSGPSGHSDPGPYWDWQYYGLLLHWDGTTEAARPLRGAWTTTDQPVVSVPAGWTVQQRRPIADSRCASWSDPYGSSFLRAAPDPAGDPVQFTLPVSAPGVYRVSLWWPRVSGANRSTPVQVQVAGGAAASATVDQTQDFGRWVDVGGELALGPAPAGVVVRVLRSSRQPGWILADGIRLLRLRAAP